MSAGGQQTTLGSKAAIANATPGKEISEPDLQFLQSLRPDLSLSELKAHALQNYAKGMSAGALKYNCFLKLYYLLPAITDHTLYRSLLARPSKGLFLDLGGGQGTDARKLCQDGYPAGQVVVSDISPFLWEVGLDLFQDGPEGPVRFVEANILNSADMAPGGALHSFLGSVGEVICPIYGSILAQKLLHASLSLQ